MLWRVRATLPDRPGALAVLANECGTSEVNILGFQVFPGVDVVTDELVLDSPSGWNADDVAALVERSGGHTVNVVPCTEAALTDQPTRYVRAAAAVLATPASFPDVLARLFDAEAEPATGDRELDVLDVTVASVLVQVRRTAPFTATEHARAAALASLVDDVLARAAAVATTAPVTGASPEFVVDAGEVTAVVDGVASARPRSGRRSTNPMPACSRSRWTRPGDAMASAAGCWARRSGWPRPRRRPSWSSRRGRTTRPCCRWCSPRACGAGSGCPATA